MAKKSIEERLRILEKNSDGIYIRDKAFQQYLNLLLAHQLISMAVISYLDIDFIKLVKDIKKTNKETLEITPGLEQIIDMIIEAIRENKPPTF